MVKVLSALALASLALQATARAVGYSPKQWIKPYKRDALQDIVTWDEDSLFVNGERIFWYSGEFHPYRLPVPDLWLDVFQKIKALGYNGVSFYVDWALLEGTPGVYREEGVFDLQPFYKAANEAGIYLLARPGPYINAEVSGGGFPGWLQRINGTLRTRAPDYLNATNVYAAGIGKSIAGAQITNGGPIILVQPENEYTGATSNISPFPDPVYFQYVEDQLRNAGIVVPFISNDASPKGDDAPGKPAPVDIYGHDGYPVGFDCANPTVWADGALPTNYRQLHLEQSPNTAYAIVEFQGGSFDPWGGPGWDKCSVLVNSEFERVFYKNNYAAGVTIFNIYMTYGGTNWGNLGHPGGYTSYDYAAVIREDRRVDREKYSEQKLQANFFKVSPAYLTASRGNASNSTWTTSSALTVTPAFGNETGFFFLRHAAYNTEDSTSYKLTVPTTAFGNITIPQINGTSLTLNGRDSKIHVTNYNIGAATLVYSTAEVFTWHKYADKTVLVVYGGPGETHELAVAATGLDVIEGSVKSITTRGYTVVNYEATSERKVVKIGVTENIYVYLLDRNSAYNYWSVDQATHDSSSAITLKAGYLVRSAKVDGSTLSLTGDINATTDLEVLGGAPTALSTLTFNGKEYAFTKDNKTGSVKATLDYTKPELTIPSLDSVTWKYLDSLPEVQSSYDDSKWTKADLAKTYNSLRPLTTPTSLYSSDYGYHTGILLYRGTFTATGSEKTIYLSTQGGSAFGSSAWLGSTFLGSFRGYDAAENGNSTYTLPNLTAGQSYTITVVIDNQGLDEDWTVGTEEMKDPRGILDYSLNGHNQSDVTWKLTGNLGGEHYKDISRGPLNEGGTFAERHGYHLPGALSASAGWKDSKGPVSDGISGPGVGFFATEFDLNLPSGYDIPLSFTFTNATTSSNSSSGSSLQAYRALIFVNGWQFGKYVSNVGPQTVYPVPQGIFNYNGTNYVSVVLWGLDSGSTKIPGLSLGVDAVVSSGFGDVGVVDGEVYGARDDAY